MSKLCLLALSLLLAAPLAQAHGGRTNAQGCHHDRKNGGYHCHNGSSSSTATSVGSQLSTTAAAPGAPVASQQDFAQCTAEVQALALEYPARLLANNQTVYSARFEINGSTQTISCFTNNQKLVQ